MTIEKLIENWIELLDVLSKWLWPITIIIIVFLFRTDITSLLKRFKRGTLFGNEIELDPQLDQLNEFIDKAKEETMSDPAIEINGKSESDLLDTEIDQVLDIAKNSPELAIMRLSILIEKETRTLLGSLGATKKKLVGLQQMFDVLTSKGYLSVNTSDALKTFSEIRNLIVHGRKPENDQYILFVIDLGIELLRTITSIPHETNIVYATGVDLYSDENCENIRDDIKGIILETTTSDRSKTYKRIFPTKNHSYYQKGKRVSWEWHVGDVWNDTWYIDNSTREKKLAWNSSLEFAGKNIEDL